MARKRSLFKYFADRKWGEAFMDGRFRFWSLAYFRDLEDNGVRGDENEGTSVFRPDHGLQVTNKTQGARFTLPLHAFTSTARCEEIFVFCMSRVFSTDLWDEFGSVVCVEITDIRAFCRRVTFRLPANAQFPGRPGRERIGHRVEYYDVAEPRGTRWALPDQITLSKLDDFAHQAEYRLVFSMTGALDFENVALRLQPADAPPAARTGHHRIFDVDVGSLRDICRIHETRLTARGSGDGHSRLTVRARKPSAQRQHEEYWGKRWAFALGKHLHAHVGWRRPAGDPPDAEYLVRVRDEN